MTPPEVRKKKGLIRKGGERTKAKSKFKIIVDNVETGNNDLVGVRANLWLEVEVSRCVRLFVAEIAERKKH